MTQSSIHCCTHLELTRAQLAHTIHAQDSHAGNKKRRRYPNTPGPQSAPLTSAMHSKHALHTSGPTSGARGTNFRVVSFDDACLGMEYLSQESALLVECPWAQVLRKFPAPLFRCVPGRISGTEHLEQDFDIYQITGQINGHLLQLIHHATWPIVRGCLRQTPPAKLFESASFEFHVCALQT